MTSPFRRRAYSAILIRDSSNVSIFGSPEPPLGRRKTQHEYRHLGMYRAGSSGEALLDKPPGSSFSYKAVDRYIIPLNEGEGGEAERGIIPGGSDKSGNTTPTSDGGGSNTTPTSYGGGSLRSSQNDRLDIDDIKLKRYHERHLIGKGKERQVRLPNYDTSLLESYKRSYRRQVVATTDNNPPSYSTTINTWSIFPTVEDIQASRLVEKQYQEAIDPLTKFPDIGDWMDLYIGEDGVFTLNKALSQMPVTGKRTTDAYKRGIKMLVLFRPLVVSGKKNRPYTELGFKFAIMDNGVYVSHVEQDSSAVRAGLKYGDQILRINNTYCSGMLKPQVEDLLRYEKLTMLVRDRPNIKVYTLLTDSKGHFGIRISKGEIVEVIRGTSAWRNGVPTNHYITEVNHQNVVGWNDFQIRKQLAESAVRNGAVTFAVMHDRAYTDIIKDVGANLLNTMDHSLDLTFSLPYFNTDTLTWNPSSLFRFRSNYENNAVEE